MCRLLLRDRRSGCRFFPRFHIRVLLSLALCAPPFLFAAGASAPIDNQTGMSVAEETVESAKSASVVTLPPEQEGDLLMARGDYAEALDAYKQGTLTSAVLWNKIGVAYHHLFAIDAAFRAYQVALTIDPHYGPALNNLAAVYHARHDYKRAVKTYKRALKYSSSKAVVYRNLGTAYFAERKYKQGIAAYRAALRLDPAIFNSGQAAIEESSTPQQLMALHYYLARIYANAGNVEQAIVNLRKAIDEGFSDRKRLQEDKGFAALRSTPQFKKFLLEEHWD